MLVRDLMTVDPVTVTPRTSLKQVLRTMADHGVTATPVVDPDGLLVGIVSEADAVAGGLEPEPRSHLSKPIVPRDPEERASAAAVMCRDVVTARPDDDLADALALLVERRHKSLPVVDDVGHVLGMLSRSDVVRLLSRSDADVAGAVTALLRRTVGGDWQVDVRDGVVHLAGSRAAFHDLVAAYLLAETVPGVLAVEEVRGAQP